MRRQEIAPRAGWETIVSDLGLIWHSASGRPYWNEAACYELTADEGEAIYAASNECYRLLLEAGDHVLRNGLLDRFGIPRWAHAMVEESWESEPPALNYGRFDFAYAEGAPPRLMEFNCDTPTSLLEASIVQWQWKEQVFPLSDQFNAIDEALVAKWQDLRGALALGPVHFAHAQEGTGEDAVTAAYMRDVAARAGIRSVQLPMDEIGWDGRSFVDLEGAAIRTLYKLYPWEWLVNEEFGRHIAEAPTVWIEPAWKMLWSNKAILPVLWDLFPDHENLLGAAFDAPRSDSYVRKPILAREGANISIVRGGVQIAGSGGDYGEEGFVYQELFDLPDFGGHRPIVGSWMVDGEACGIGIREGGLITDNAARFVPHVIQSRP